MGFDWEDILDTEEEDLEEAYKAHAARAEGDKHNVINDEEPAERHTAPRGGKKYVTGTWNGETVSFKKVWQGHTFTKGEIKKLLAGEEIDLKGIQGLYGTYNVRGKLKKQTFKGRNFVGFTPLETSNPDKYCAGIWRGTEVRFKKTFKNYMFSHTFTDEECAKLLADEVIEFPASFQNGTEYTVKGHLENLEYDGRKYVGFKPTDWQRFNHSL